MILNRTETALPLKWDKYDSPSGFSDYWYAWSPLGRYIVRQTEEGFAPGVEGMNIPAPSFPSPEDAMASAQRHHERSFPPKSLRYDISKFNPIRRARTLTRMSRDIARAKANGTAPLYELEGTWQDVRFEWIEVAPNTFETSFGKGNKGCVRLSDEDGLWHSSLDDRASCEWQHREEAFEAVEIGIRYFVETEVARSSERQADFEFVTIGKMAA
jgi:hypothetical protein